MSRVFTMLIFRPYPKCGIYPRRVWPAGVVGACLRGKDIVPVCVVVSYSLILVLPQNPCSCNPLFERASSLKHFLALINTSTLFTRPTPLPFSSVDPLMAVFTDPAQRGRGRWDSQKPSEY